MRLAKPEQHASFDLELPPKSPLKQTQNWSQWNPAGSWNSWKSPNRFDHRENLYSPRLGKVFSVQDATVIYLT